MLSLNKLIWTINCETLSKPNKYTGRMEKKQLMKVTKKELRSAMSVLVGSLAWAVTESTIL
jgi:hypothetical protein